MGFTDEQYEQMAIKAIIDHKNKDYTDNEIKILYPLAIPIIIENIKKSLKVDRNISQMTQGPRSVTYKDSYNIIDDNVRFIIGKSYVKMW